ncbi:alpha-L-fucosidase [Gemmiger sp. An194]|uniref:alpha-L-fucosidase n=1 Tax=Gemmiger sp. An194 TaxID=1965582 RepID=UPI0023BA1F5C|nr:alpha-L-fucosidase [Gemmiger sp. An194]
MWWSLPSTTTAFVCGIPTPPITACAAPAATTDVVAAVAAACKKYGLALGLYYSLWDRSEPRYTRDFAGEYIPYMQAQLTELMDGRYDPIAELWLDGGWDKARSQWRLEELYDLVKRLQPEC